MKSRFTLFTITFLLLMINSELEISAADNGNSIPEK